MSVHSDIAPDTLGVDVDEDAVRVTYSDGRVVSYRAPRREVSGSVRTRPGRNVQVLVTDDTETEGVFTYVNERNTGDEILEHTGVGRLLVENGERRECFPGVTVQCDGPVVEVDANLDVVGGAVYVFDEDELGEVAYEFVD